MKLKYLGICGILSLLSYTAMVVFSPLAYPGYNWITAAVSELTAVDAPSLGLATQLNALFGPCGIVCISAVSVACLNTKSKVFKVGILLFLAMMWITNVGYTMFPYITDAEANNIQNVMHLIVTVLVVLLSIASLVTIFVGSRFDKSQKVIGILALVTLGFMMLGAIGTNAFKSMFGIFERFSTFSVVVYNACLGIWLLLGMFDGNNKSRQLINEEKTHSNIL